MMGEIIPAGDGLGGLECIGVDPKPHLARNLADGSGRPLPGLSRGSPEPQRCGRLTSPAKQYGRPSGQINDQDAETLVASQKLGDLT